jgi:hypothetical protein
MDLCHAQLFDIGRKAKAEIANPPSLRYGATKAEMQKCGNKVAKAAGTGLASSFRRADMTGSGQKTMPGNQTNGMPGSHGTNAAPKGSRGTER